MKIEEFIQKSVFFSINKACFEICNRIEVDLKKHDLNVTEAMILAALFFEKSQVNPSSLATTLSTTRSNISHHVTRLEKREFLKRGSHLRDARQYPLHLLPKGAEHVQMVIKIFNCFENQLEQIAGANFPQKMEKLIQSVRSLG